MFITKNCGQRGVCHCRRKTQLNSKEPVENIPRPPSQGDSAARDKRPTTRRATDGMISLLLPWLVVKVTSTNFSPAGNSTKAASCRVVLVHPAFDQSFAPSGKALPV